MDMIEANPLRAKLLIALVIVACGAILIHLHDIADFFAGWLA